MKRIFLIIMLFSNLCYSQTNRLYVDKWEFRNTKEQKYYKALVPGTIHTDLFANKLIEDPFYGTNESSLQWIENEEWEYIASLGLTAEQIKTAGEIVFEGLDTYASVYVNGEKMLSANNMFREWRIKCSGLLKQGENEIRIVFRPPTGEEEKLAREFEKQTALKELPGGNRAFTRKAAYHYGWDWSPRFVTCGIWRPAYLEFDIEGTIKEIETTQNLSDGKAIIKFNVRCGNAEGLRAILLQKGNKISESRVVSNEAEITAEIQNPELWWCNGLGEPHLYGFNIVLRNKDGQDVDKKEINIGIRTIELVQEKDTFGSSFYFKLNGVPVFIKGANYIPPDNFLPGVTKEKYARLIDDAVKSNMNMLRVWGGGVYEDDEFYKQCDERGILVWQDFAFACSMVPPDKDFADNVREEAVYNVRRLRNHPCIALWCGNNESDEGWQNWGWQNKLTDAQKQTLWSAYENIFKNILPSVVSEYHKNSNHISTSPKIGWGHEESLKEGDSHYWGVWWGMEPFEVYNTKIGRFASEYGFQGFPDLETIKSFVPPDELYLYSPSLKMHQKHPTGFETIQKYIEMYYDAPDKLERYITISQLLQAYGIKTAIEAHRRAKPYCMGTLYWQFNDCNPVVSWSGIDYFGRWKGMQETVKNAYADILVSPVEENGKIRVYIVSDRMKETKGMLEVRFESFSGIIPSEPYLTTVTVKPNSSEIFFEKDAAEVFRKVSKTTNYMNVILRVEDGKTYSNELLFCKPKEIETVK